MEGCTEGALGEEVRRPPAVSGQRSGFRGQRLLLLVCSGRRPLKSDHSALFETDASERMAA